MAKLFFLINPTQGYLIRSQESCLDFHMGEARLTVLSDRLPGTSLTRNGDRSECNALHDANAGLIRCPEDARARIMTLDTEDYYRTNAVAQNPEGVWHNPPFRGCLRRSPPPYSCWRDKHATDAVLPQKRRHAHHDGAPMSCTKENEDVRTENR